MNDSVNRIYELSAWRLRGSYLTTIISTSLVLFAMGLLGIFLLHANQIANYAKENMGFTLMLKENISEINVRHLQKNLDTREYVNATEFISKEQAAKELEQEKGLQKPKILFQSGEEDYTTLKKYAIVIGKTKPVIEIPNE